MATATRRNPVDKHAERRRALADSALKTLGELGYARASLREIAGNSPFSHGVVHYYFEDKLDLIVYCVRQYKATCVTRYDAVVDDAGSAEHLLSAFCAKLRETLRDETAMHRLWYDLRSQSLFEAKLVEAVEQIDQALAEMIWRVVTRYAELADSTPAVDEATAYATLDGIFQQALIGHVHHGGEHALDALEQRVRAVLPLLLRR